MNSHIYEFKKKLEIKENERNQIRKKQLQRNLLELLYEINHIKRINLSKKLEMTLDIAKELIQFCQVKCGDHFEEVDKVSSQEIDLYNQVVNRCLCEMKKCKQEQQQKNKISWKEPGK